MNRILLIAATILWVASSGFGAERGFFTVDRLIINGADCTKYNGCTDLDTVGKPAKIVLSFTLDTTQSVDISRLAIACRSVSEAWPDNKSYSWGGDCQYDPATHRGVFRLNGDRPVPRALYEFSVDAGKISPHAPSRPVYAFSFTGYPSVGSSGFHSLPAYALPQLKLDSIFGLHPIVYARLSRNVPPSTSLYFEFRLPRFWPAGEPAEKHLKIRMVKIDRSFANPFRPLLSQSDLPPGEETLLYDATKGGAQNAFSVAVKPGPSGYTVWIRKPVADGPDYQNAPYLEPGCAYSLQFELVHEVCLGKRYEVSRFTVRPEPEKKPVTVTADYAAPTFIDWQGDWFNGHLLAADDTPTAGWGRDFLLQKQMRDQYPDLWRTIDWYYPYSNGASMCFEGSNLFRDLSTRVVARVEQTSPTEAVVTLTHFLGARYYHDPDNEKDRLSDHPVVGDDRETVFRKGDRLFLLSGRSEGVRAREATVKAVRTQANQLVLSVKEPIGVIKPEGAPHAYPAVLGLPGTQSTTITLAGEMTGTYLRLQNGRPFVNWAIFDHKFDFFVHFMGMRVSIHQEQPHDFVGDGLNGEPSATGWQLVSDCEYYMTRHLLMRYHAKLGDFNHCIYGETRWQWGRGKGMGVDYLALYDYISDGILRAYEEVLHVKGDDYRKVVIGVGGVQMQWDIHHMIATIAAHVLPAPLEKIFPADAPSTRFAGELPTNPVGSNPFYYLTPEDRQKYRDHKWQYNACLLDGKGEPMVGDHDWDGQGRLTKTAAARLRANGWHHSRWLLENTRYGKGSPFRQVSAEGYSHTAESLARLILFEKELLTQLDRNLRNASSDPYVRDYLQGIECGTKQIALYDWGAFARTPGGRPWVGTGYWPTYFAEVMRRVLAETAKHPRGIYDHGTFTFDSFTWPDGNNGGCDSDVATFTPDTGVKAQTVMYGPIPVQFVPQQVGWAKVGRGKRIPVVENQVALEKDIRHFIRFVGMMSHRLSALPEQEVNGHVISGVMSKYCDRPGTVYETGNGPGDKTRFWMLLYDHNPPDLESQDGAASSVALQVRNLPKKAKSVRVTVYRVDRDHSSLFTLTERMRDHGPIYSASEIAALKNKAALARDEDFAGNGTTFDVSDGGLDLPLTLGTNRVLFVEVDWGNNNRSN